MKTIIRAALGFFGYYKAKKVFKMHFYLKRLRREDSEKRRIIDDAIKELPNNILKKENELIVSLTSFDHRIIDSLPYTLYSLLLQDELSGRITVYLSRDEINDETLPPALKKFKSCGVEFYYVSDIRSYKKLIPALSMFPDNPILTVDDDTYYDRNFIKSFREAYNKSDKRTVLGTMGTMVTYDDNGRLKPYSEWETPNEENIKIKDISFFGMGGCLYPPHIFDDEILNKEVFTKLSPFADDLWFWVMEQRCRIKTQLLENYKQNMCSPIDRTSLYDEWTRPDCLTSINDGQKKNDEQLFNLIKYYGLNFADKQYTSAFKQT